MFTTERRIGNWRSEKPRIPVAVVRDMRGARKPRSLTRVVSVKPDEVAIKEERAILRVNDWSAIGEELRGVRSR